MDYLLTQLASKAGPTQVALPAGWVITDGILVPSQQAGISVVGAGTAYALTNAAAAIVLGTTSPAKVISKAGTWLILAWLNLKANAATIAGETATLKLRRTNNTAADLTGGSVTLNPPAMTTTTQTILSGMLPPVLYTTSNIDDSLSLFGNVSATLGAGTLDVVAATIVAIPASLIL